MLRTCIFMFLLLIGLLMMIFGFLSHAANAIPYQDATPDMLAAQSAAGKRWLALSAFGALVSIGTALLWFRRAHGRDNPRSK